MYMELRYRMNELGSENSQEITVVSIQEKDISEVALLQKSVFKGYLNARIGLPYVRAFIGWFQKSEEAIALCAIDEPGTILGFVVGAPANYSAALNREVLLPAAAGILLRPWIFFDSHFRSVVAGRLSGMMSRASFNNKPASAAAFSLPEPMFSLVGIGVHTAARGKKIGEGLMIVFEKEAAARNAKSMRLSVYADNVAARKLYEKVGWKPSENPREPKQAMHYCRIIERDSFHDWA